MKPLDPRLVRRSRGVRRLLGVSVVLSLGAAAAVVAQAALIAAAVAGLFAGRNVVTPAVAAAGCFAVRAVLQWAHAVVSARAAAAVKAELRTDVAADLLDPRRVGPAPSGASVVALLGPGFDAFEGYVARFLPQVVLASLIPPLVIVSMLVVDPLSALIVAITLPLSIVFMVLVGLLTRDTLSRRWEALDRLGRHFGEVLSGIVVLKLFGRRQETGLRAVGDQHRRETVRSLRVAFLSSLVLELVATLSVALVAVSVGLRVVEDRISLEHALLVLLLAPEAYLPIRNLGAMFHDSTEGAEAVDSALALLDHDRHAGTLAAPDLATTSIALSDVLVRHDDRRAPSLDLASETIRPGELVVVQGPSGSGKSTLLDVLLGFTAPSSGTVQVGEHTLSDLDPDSWRRQIAWVPQVPGLVEGTVAANVRLANRHASDDDVLRALAGAGADDLAPGRWISESATDVSAGERRRIAVARALLRVRTEQARLVLMDEPTAGLDAAREATVLASLHGLDVTVVVVAHRPDAIATATRVLTLQPAQVPA